MTLRLYGALNYSQNSAYDLRCTTVLFILSRMSGGQASDAEEEQRQRSFSCSYDYL